MATESMFQHIERSTQEPGLANELRNRFHNTDRHRVAFGDIESRKHLADLSSALSYLPPRSANKIYPSDIAQTNTNESFVNTLNSMKDMGFSMEDMQSFIDKFEKRCNCPRKRLHNGNILKLCSCF